MVIRLRQSRDHVVSICPGCINCLKISTAMAQRNTNYDEIQQNELEVLRSIFMEDFVEEEMKTVAWNVCRSKSKGRAAPLIYAGILNCSKASRVVVGITLSVWSIQENALTELTST